MPELETLKLFLSFGVGGLVAILLLLWKRADDKSHREEMKEYIDNQEKMESKMIDAMMAQAVVLQTIKESLSQMLSIRSLEERLREIERSK